MERLLQHLEHNVTKDPQVRHCVQLAYELGRHHGGSFYVEDAEIESLRRSLFPLPERITLRKESEPVVQMDSIPDTDEVSIAMLKDAGLKPVSETKELNADLFAANAKLSKHERQRYAAHIVTIDTKSQCVLGFRKDILLDLAAKCLPYPKHYMNAPVSADGQILVMTPGHRI
jgi:hypothetical protein